MFREKHNGVYSNGDISLRFSYNKAGNLVSVLVEERIYATIENLDSIDILDELAVCDWVDNTYYTDDYLCDAYIAPYLQARDFEATYKGGE